MEKSAGDKSEPNEINGGDEVVAKDIAMHVSAFNPLCLSEDDIDKDVLDRERAIYQNQANESGKPKEIMDKMVEGKIKRFLSEVSLLSQSFVKDPDITVSDYLSQNSSNIVSFSRLKVICPELASYPRINCSISVFNFDKI